MSEIAVTLTEAQAKALVTPVSSVDIREWNRFADDYDDARAVIRRALGEQAPEIPPDQSSIEGLAA